MEKKRIYPENTPPGNIPYNVVNPAFRYRAIVPADDSIVMEVDANGVLYVAAQGLRVETPVVTIQDNIITATCATEGAMILFTYDTGGIIIVCAYGSPIEIDDVVRAPITFWAQKGGMVPSNYVYPTYPPFCVFEKYKSRIKIYDFNTLAEGEILYTLDGRDPIDYGIVYDGNDIRILEPCTLKAVIQFQDGTYSPITTKKIHALIINTEVTTDYGNNTVTAVAHVFDEKGYAVSADIYFTIDGTDPNTGSSSGNFYERNIYGEETTTVKFIAYADYCIRSQIATCEVGEEQVQPPTITFEPEHDGSILAYIDGIPEGGIGYFTIKYSINAGIVEEYESPFYVNVDDTVEAYVEYIISGEKSNGVIEKAE